jgi:FMN phosphatase YigB (HAD superfamily)
LTTSTSSDRRRSRRCRPYPRRARRNIPPYWEDIVLGRAELMDHVSTALQKIAPHVCAADFVSYWFERDSRLVAPFLAELSVVRGAGIRVYLPTNQEHLRAAYLMERLGLADHVDGIFIPRGLAPRNLTGNSSRRFKRRLVCVAKRCCSSTTVAKISRRR